MARLLTLALLLSIACATAGRDDPDAAPNPIDASGQAIDSSADAPPAITEFLLSEFVFNHGGLDTSEFIEVIGPANADASNHAVVVLEGDLNAGPGTLLFVESLSTTSASGHVATAFFADGLQNGSQTVLLVTDMTGAVGTDLDTNDDGTLDVEPWTAIVDGLAIGDGDVGDLEYSAVALAPDYDGGTLSVGGASRVPNTVDSDTPADWTRNDFDGDGLPCCPAATAATGEALNTPGATNAIAP